MRAGAVGAQHGAHEASAVDHGRGHGEVLGGAGGDGALRDLLGERHREISLLQHLGAGGSGDEGESGGESETDLHRCVLQGASGPVVRRLSI